MIAYRKERIENAMLFFAREHHKKTKQYLSETALHKYLAFFEFRMLDAYGEMPLELQYKAMEHGPVPIEIYSQRDKANIFSSVVFEPIQTTKGGSAYIVKPVGKFNSDYFSEVEMNEMNNLIEIFARKWINASIMSDTSHRDIRAWKKTYETSHNAIIDPIKNFARDIISLSEEELTTPEEHFLIQKRLNELAGFKVPK